MWQKIKLEKPNVVTKVILEPSVIIVVETHFKIDITTVKVDNHMAIIRIQVGKNIVGDVLLRGGLIVNITIEYLKPKLGLPKPRPTPYHFKMTYQNVTKPLGIIIILKIHIHGMPYVATFIILQNTVVESNYSMLLGRPWLKNAKVTHDWGNNVIIVQGNGTIRPISVNKKLGAKTRRFQVLVCYDLLEGLTYQMEDMVFETKPKLFLIGTISISTKRISMTSIGMLEIRINEEFEPKQGRSYQKIAKVLLSTTKPK
jgi:hypothetical protein